MSYGGWTVLKNTNLWGAVMAAKKTESPPGCSESKVCVARVGAKAKIGGDTNENTCMGCTVNYYDMMPNLDIIVIFIDIYSKRQQQITKASLKVIHIF